MLGLSLGLKANIFGLGLAARGLVDTTANTSHTEQ